jgi:hypothetical protein
MVDKELNKLLEKLAKNSQVTDVASWTKPSNQLVSSIPNTQWHLQFNFNSRKITTTVAISTTTTNTITTTTTATAITITTTTTKTKLKLNSMV